jgi:hypothetical protein
MRNGLWIQKDDLHTPKKYVKIKGISGDYFGA